MLVLMPTNPEGHLLSEADIKKGILLDAAQSKYVSWFWFVYTRTLLKPKRLIIMIH